MRETKDAAAVRAFPSAIPLAVVGVGVLLECWIPLASGSASVTPVRYVLGGAIVAGAILDLGLWSVVMMRRSGQDENPWKPTTEILERGPYRITRNPMYLQRVLVCAGVAILLWNAWILLLTARTGRRRVRAAAAEPRENRA